MQIKLFFPSCSFIYIGSHLEVTAVVNIVSACVVMCVAPVSLSFWCPCSPFLFVMSVSVSHSSAPASESWCSVSFAYCVFDVWPVVLLPLCSWYHVIVFLVISVFFVAFSCRCCVRSGLSRCHLRFYLCIIFFRGISTLVSICYHVPQSRWWPFSLTTLLNAPRNLLLPPFMSFFFFLVISNNWICRKVFHAWFLFFFPLHDYFPALVPGVYTYFHLYQTRFALKDAPVSVCDFDFRAAFGYACVYTAANQRCYIRFRASCDSEQMVASFQEDPDSWRKLELRAQVMIEKGGRTREVITVKPMHREHPSAAFPPLGVWHRCKTPPRLIHRAARMLNKFILKWAVKQNQLFCI